MPEPILTKQDRSIWQQWSEIALMHATTPVHRRRVDCARDLVAKMMASNPDAYVAWSAGKDSTALVHLVTVDCGARGRVMSVKDDLDFPGEEDYLRRWAAAWGIAERLDVLHPPFSLQQWIRDHAADLDAAEDMHSRACRFATAAFYSVVEEYRDRAGMPGVYLGLRAAESRGRSRNRMFNGATYTKKSGETVCNPLSDWEGIDVYAYLLSRGIDVLDVYRCVRMESSPDRVRKSWWIVGAMARKGGIAWLKAYWPSLYGRLVEMLPEAGAWS